MGVRRVTGRSHSPPRRAWLVVGMVASLAVMLPAAVIAQTNVPVDPAYWRGQFRSTPDTGVFATGYDQSGSGDHRGWDADAGGFKIAWLIEPVSGGWSYTYTITNATNGNLDKEMSHFILEVSEGFTSGNYNESSVTGGTATLGTWTANDQGASNPGMPAPIYGLKFDPSNGLKPSISFVSNKAPVWGDFYAKDGSVGSKPVYARNMGFGTDPAAATTDFTKWIPRPDSKGPQGEMPEPTTVALLVPMVAPLGLLARRRTGA